MRMVKYMSSLTSYQANNFTKFFFEKKTTSYILLLQIKFKVFKDKTVRSIMLFNITVAPKRTWEIRQLLLVFLFFLLPA